MEDQVSVVMEEQVSQKIMRYFFKKVLKRLLLWRNKFSKDDANFFKEG